MGLLPGNRGAFEQAVSMHISTTISTHQATTVAVLVYLPLAVICIGVVFMLCVLVRKICRRDNDPHHD
jgi:heme/copper-type cytochrome/quinol oxidase subunit 2